MGRFAGITGKSRERSTERLEREQQEQKRCEFFSPVLHECAESIEKPQVPQYSGTDIAVAVKFMTLHIPLVDPMARTVDCVLQYGVKRHE